MAGPLYELLAPYLSETAEYSQHSSETSTAYLARLTTLSLTDLSTTEPVSLAQSSQSILRSLQALSKRSHRSIIESSTHLSLLSSTIPGLYEQAKNIEDALPELEQSSTSFASKYKRSTESENDALLRRRKALLLTQNADRISSILDLPTLLSSAVSSSTPSASGVTASSNTTANYGSALDLHAHIKRLTTLHPESPLISSISVQADHEMRQLTSALIANLQSQNLKLAGAMRMIGYLRRVAPELDSSALLHTQKSVTNKVGGGYGPSISAAASMGSNDGAIGALFLVCRLANLNNMLEALDPLKELADQELKRRMSNDTNGTATEGDRTKRAPISSKPGQGQQTERYLKRYLEIFREQSFAIVSMYRNIFPSALPVPSDSNDVSYPSTASTTMSDAFTPPSPLSTFVPHLVSLLFSTLQTYLPNVADRSARDSLMTQILYCAGSLGRLGGDFSMHLALLEEDLREAEENGGVVEEDSKPDWEWAEVMKRHRIQASRLELLASGAGVGRSTTGQSGTIGEREVRSPPIAG